LYPREVEEVIMQNKEVSLVAIIGVPDDRLGEEIKAYVVLKERGKIPESELMHWVKDRIAVYKYPRIIEFVDGLPMNATGKILKRKLRDRTTS